MTDNPQNQNKQTDRFLIGKVILVVWAFAVAVAVKGGWIGKFYSGVPSWVDNHLPPVIIGAVTYAFTLDPFIALRCILAAYVLKFSMGEEAGAVINNVGNNQYIDNPDDFGRDYGIKKAVQRGITDGAAFCLATWNPLFIFAGLTFVPIYWVMSKIKYKITGVNDWSWAEPVYGVAFGLALASHIFGWVPDVQVM